MCLYIWKISIFETTENLSAIQEAIEKKLKNYKIQGDSAKYWITNEHVHNSGDWFFI